MDTEWITIPEAAALARCSTRTIRRRITDGDLPAFRFGPRLIRVDKAAVTGVMQPLIDNPEKRPDVD